MAEIRSDNRAEFHPKPVQEYERRFTGSTWVDWADTAELEAVYNVAYRPNKYFWIAGHYFECLSDGITYRQIDGGGGGFTTADNGLTANTATNVQLGGTLIKDTTIDAQQFLFGISNAKETYIESDNGSQYAGVASKVDLSDNYSQLYSSDGTTINLFNLRPTGAEIRFHNGNSGGTEQVITFPFTAPNPAYYIPLSISVNGGSPAVADAAGNIPITVTGGVSTIQWSVLDILNTPPAATAGDIYLVGTAGTGAWAGHNNEIATYNGATWTFQTAAVGDILYDANDDLTYQNVTGNTWVNVGKLSIHQGGDSYATPIRIGSIDNTAFFIKTHNINRISITNAGAISLLSLTGVGSQVVGIDANGLLSRVDNASGLAWLLASGGTLSAVNTITSSRPNGLIFTGTWTQTANNDYAFKVNPTITGDATASDKVQALLIQPTMTAGAATQVLAAVTIDATNIASTNSPARYALRIIANSTTGFNGILFSNTVDSAAGGANISINNQSQMTVNSGNGLLTLGTNTVITSGSLKISGGTGASPFEVAIPGGETTSAASMLFASAATVGYRVNMGKDGSSQVLTANLSAADVIIAAGQFNTAATGTHALIANTVIQPPSFNVSAGASVTNTATLYLNGAQSGIVTPSGKSYILWSAGTGPNRFDGIFNAGGTDLTANQIWGANNGATAMEGKTLSGTTNQISVTHGAGTITLNVGSNIVDLTTSQSLSNKTLTAPIIASIVNTGTLTLPTVAGTVVQYATASIASSATPAPTGDAAVNFLYITALSDATATFAAPSGTPTNGNSLIIRILDNGTSRTLAWNGVYRSSTDLPLPTATTISKTMYLKFIYNSAGSGTWDFVSLLNNF